MPSAADHMIRAREALVKQRHEIDRSIAELDKLISRLDGTATQGPRPPRAQAGTVRAAVLEDLTRDPSPWPVSKILAELHARAEFVALSDASLRSILNKMRERNEITNPFRGQYQIVVDSPGESEPSAQPEQTHSGS